jgi:ribose 5-phosphate isomerase B
VVAKAVNQGQHAWGVLCCGSGIGMAMAANRFPGVRAVVGNDLYAVTMSRRHNDANVLCLGGKVVTPDVAQELLKVFLNTPFEGGRHQERVKQIDTLSQGDPQPC